MAIVFRPERAVLRFSGKDAQKLLNDVLTGPVSAEAGPARWWALLSAQGKVQAEGLIGWAEDALWLDVHAGVAEAFLKRMKMYRLRAEVTIDDLRESHAVGWSASGEAAGLLHADVRAAGLGVRLIAPRAAVTAWQDGDGSYAGARIAAGVAELGPDFAVDSIFPHDIGMDFLGGVDFKKGCYIGQEVVSRMQHRGTARRRPVIATALPDGAAAGAPIMVGEREAGTIGTPVNGAAVAILRLDRVADPEGATLGGLPIKLALPDWAGYRFGEVAAVD